MKNGRKNMRFLKMERMFFCHFLLLFSVDVQF